MAGKLTTLGQTNILTWFFENDQSSRTADKLYLGIYEDTTEPVVGSTLSTITECTGTGYARINLLDADWTIVTDTATNLEKTFTATADWTTDVYGSFICDVSTGTSGLLLAVKHFTAAPFTVLNTKTVAVVPTMVIV